MGKNAIYTANTVSQTITAGSTINLGSIIRRIGCLVNLTDDGITTKGAGYYRISVNITATGTEAGTAVFTIYDNGVPVNGATASVTMASGDLYNISLDTVIRECYCEGSSIITVVLSGEDAIINNIVVVAERW